MPVYIVTFPFRGFSLKKTSANTTQDHASVPEVQTWLLPFQLCRGEEDEEAAWGTEMTDNEHVTDKEKQKEKWYVGEIWS